MESISSFAAAHAIYVVALASFVCLVVGVLIGMSLKRDKPPRQDEDDTEKGNGGKRQGLCELYVGNLPYEMTDDGMKKLLVPFGEVASARVITNRLSGASKGYGFAKMSDTDEARAAVKALNGKEIEGRRIVVSEAKTRPRSRRD